MKGVVIGMWYGVKLGCGGGVLYCGVKLGCVVIGMWYGVKLGCGGGVWYYGMKLGVL